jgi:hypothetical protein
MVEKEIPETRYPYFVAVGFGGDGGMALSMANLAGQAVNSTEVPEVPRPRPIDGEAQCVEALLHSAPLTGLPLVVRSQEDGERLDELTAKEAVLIDSVEQDARTSMLTPSQRWVERWEAGGNARSLGHQYLSLDEARNLSSRLFYCLSGLSIDDRRMIWQSRASWPATDNYWERRNSRSAHTGQ